MKLKIILFNHRHVAIKFPVLLALVGHSFPWLWQTFCRNLLSRSSKSEWKRKVRLPWLPFLISLTIFGDQTHYNLYFYTRNQNLFNSQLHCMIFGRVSRDWKGFFGLLEQSLVESEQNDSLSARKNSSKWANEHIGYPVRYC